MRIRYFEDTDTLLIELRQAPAAETRDLDENTVVFDAQGQKRHRIALANIKRARLDVEF